MIDNNQLIDQLRILIAHESAWISPRTNEYIEKLRGAVEVLEERQQEREERSKPLCEKLKKPTPEDAGDTG